MAMSLAEQWTKKLDRYEKKNPGLKSTSFMLRFDNGRYVQWHDLDEDGLPYELSGYRRRSDDDCLDFVNLENLSKVVDVLAEQDRRIGWPERRVRLVVAYRSCLGSKVVEFK
jgi:hypothetical protein